MRKNQDGSALVLAVFVLALLTAMGVALLFLSQNEVKMGEASIRPKKAFYHAEAGLEHARQALWLLNDAQNFDNDLITATGGVATDPIDFDPETIAPIYDSDGNVTGFSGYGDDAPFVDVQQLDDGWYAAFLSNDHAEGRTNQVDTDNRIILTGVGVGPDLSMEVVEAVIDIQTMLPELPPAAVFMLGPTPNFQGANSGNKVYSGNDCGSTTGDYYPAIGAVGSAAEAAIEAGVNSGPTYEAGPSSTPADVISDMSSSPVSGMSDTTYTMDPGWESCQTMIEVVEAYRERATYTCPDLATLKHPSCPAVLSDPANIYFGEGELKVSDNEHHYGTLVVTGDLVLGGGVDFSGNILVIGSGRIRFNGSGGGVIRGSVITANIAGPDGVYGTADDCTGGTNGFGISGYDENGGGNAGTIYCSSAIHDADHAKPYEILEFRQR